MTAYLFLDLLWHVLCIAILCGSGAVGVVLIETALDYQPPKKASNSHAETPVRVDLRV